MRSAGGDLMTSPDKSRHEANVALGDAESLRRLRERTQETITCPAGSTPLVDPDIPPVGPEDLGGRQSAS